MKQEIMRLEPAVIIADFEAMQVNLDAAIEPYKGMTVEQVAAMPLADVKACAKDLRGMKKELEESRRAIKREYNKPLDAFEAGVKALVAQIDDHLKLYADAEATAEEIRKGEKEDALRSFYEDFAPALVPVVPFERIMNPRWLNKTFAKKKAEDELQEIVERIARDWETLKQTTLNFPAEAEAEFFRSLDIGAAISHDTALRAENDRIQALRAEVEPDPIPEPVAPEIPYVAEVPEATQTMVAPAPEFEWVMTFKASELLKNELIGFCKIHGIHGNLQRIAPQEAAQTDQDAYEHAEDVPVDIYESDMSGWEGCDEYQAAC